MRRDIEEFETKDSGWSLQEILYLTININRLNPVRGSSYITLPLQIENKHACINVKNKYNECFKWAVLLALYPQKDHTYNVDLYKPFKDTLDFKGINFPVVPRTISKFEKQNNISINLYIFKKYGEDYRISLCHIT